jgi:hypothetical protein
MTMYKRTHLLVHRQCLDYQNRNNLAGPCLDNSPRAQLRLLTTNQRIVDGMAKKCTMADIAALGFPGNCAFEAATGGVEAQCAALPVTTVAQFTECLKCWKGAELKEFEAILYASHALELCGGDLGETSPRCSDLDCTTPLPVQRNLGSTGENDCQRAIGRSGMKYLLDRERILEMCARRGGTRASCLDNGNELGLRALASLARAEQQKINGIKKMCGNRAPVPDPPFCCRTGTGNQCTAAATREDCLSVVGQTVQENKTCGVGLTCDPVPGGQSITWWSNCPESDTCPGTALADINDLIDCVDTAANAIVDELLCFQIRSNGGADWPCPTETP